MPRLLEVDPVEEQDSIEKESWRLGSTDGTPDLSDGGDVNGVRVRPARDKTVTKGRPVARLAYNANGTESQLLLTYEPNGKNHDSAAAYFRKRLCLCCGRGGFKGHQCPQCVKNNCSLCNGSRDPKKIIPCFYRRREDAPFAVPIYGSIDCFLVSCLRRGALGFLTETDMRLHARSNHRMEYQAYVESQAASKVDEVAELRKRVDDLMVSMARGSAQPAAQPEPQKTGRSEAQKEAARKLGASSKATWERRKAKAAA